MTRTKLRGIVKNNLARLQIKNGVKLTLRAFSDKCGILQSTLHNYLHGRDMKLSMAVKICETHGVSLDWFVGREGDTKTNYKLKHDMLVNEVKAQQKSMAKTLKDMEV